MVDWTASAFSFSLLASLGTFDPRRGLMLTFQMICLRKNRGLTATKLWVSCSLFLISQFWECFSTTKVGMEAGSFHLAQEGSLAPIRAPFPLFSTKHIGAAPV